MDELQFVELSTADISQDVLQKFDCAHPDFNDYLKMDAISCSANGKGVTYVLVDKNEYENKSVTTIFAFATLQTSALLYHDTENEKTLRSMPCVEIKYFAIARRFHKQTAYLIDPNKHYSTIFFECLLSELYLMSTTMIGFQALFLRANEMGHSLYVRKKFINASDYIIPFEEDDPLGKCTPMFLMIQENMYTMFGYD